MKGACVMESPFPSIQGFYMQGILNIGKAKTICWNQISLVHLPKTCPEFFPPACQIAFQQLFTWKARIFELFLVNCHVLKSFWSTSYVHFDILFASKHCSHFIAIMGTKIDLGTLPCRIVPPRVLLGPMLALPPQVSYSALGFQLLPPQAIILPQVFFFCHPRLLFHPRFSLFPPLGYFSALGFLFLPP